MADYQTPNPDGPVREGGRPTARGEAAAPAALPAPPPQPSQPETGPMVTGNEETDALFGPTLFPEEPITTGLAASKIATPPPGFSRTIQDLVAASKDPTAPPALKNLVRLLAYHLSPSE